MGKTESPHASLGHEPGALTLVCETCLPDLELRRQDAIWQSGDRYYELIRWFGDNYVTVAMGISVRSSPQRRHYWMAGEVTEREFPIRKGEPWKRLKERMPDWITRMLL